MPCDGDGGVGGGGRFGEDGRRYLEIKGEEMVLLEVEVSELRLFRIW